MTAVSSGNAPPAVAPERTGFVIGALRRLLRPLVRLLIDHQVTYPQLTEILKDLYVRSALTDFRIPHKRQTDSRVSLLTGVHRKDVRRLRSAPSEDTEVPASISLGAQVAVRWTTDPRFLNERGRPRPLPRRASDATGASFEDLVASVSRDIRPRAVLDEWLRLGVVEHDRDSDLIRLHSEAFVPEKGFEEKAYYMGHHLHDHIATTVHNLAGDSPALLERNVHYSTLTPESVAELERLARELGMEALLAVNRRASELKQRDAEREDATQRMSFGVYFFTEPAAGHAPGDEHDEQ